MDLIWKCSELEGKKELRGNLLIVCCYIIMVNSDDKYLLHVKEFPKNQADIESLILRRIGEYSKIEVGGLLMTNSYEFREIRYCTGDKHNIDPDTCKYIFEVDKEQFHKIVYFLSRNFIKKE